jgi:hypothetical protein
MSTFTAAHKGRTFKVRAKNRLEAGQKAMEVALDLDNGIVKRVKRNRETGTTILLVDRNLTGGPEGDGNDARWETICEPHGTVCSHETRAVAEGFMAEPTTWCEDCQADYSTAGKGSWDDFNDNDEED